MYFCIAPDGSKKTSITTWECFNYALKGMADQMIKIGAPPEIRVTVFQLWTHYLRLHEAAFFSKNKPELPRLGFVNNFHDKQLLYNAERKPAKIYDRSRSAESLSNRAKKRKLTNLINLSQTSEYNSMYASQKSLNASSLADLSASDIRSLTSSASSAATIKLDYSKKFKEKAFKPTMDEEHLEEHANDHEGKLKCCGKEVKLKMAYHSAAELLTTKTLLLIINIALDIHETDYTLSDLIRFCREEHLSMKEFHHFFPKHISLDDIQYFNSRAKHNQKIEHKMQRMKKIDLEKFLDVIPRTPDLHKLCKRYIEELELPQEMLQIVTRLINFWEPELKKSYLELAPFYEGRAISYIIFVLKLLFGLNGETENLISGKI